jgi:S1-C subfamily serine protease
MTDDKKPKGKRRSRKTPVAGAPEASPPIAAERSAEVAPAAPEAAAASSVPEAARPEPVAAGDAAQATPETAAGTSAPEAPRPEPAMAAAARTDAAPARPETAAASPAPDAAQPEPAMAAAARTDAAPARPETAAASPAPDTARPEPAMAAAARTDAAPARPETAAASPALDAAQPELAAASSAAPEAARPEPAIAAGAPADAARASDGEPAAAEAQWPVRERRVRERRGGDRRGGVDASAVETDHDGWPLDTSESYPPAEPVQPPAPPPHAPASAMPSPAAAAYEAARIVGEMVGDIESAPGAALVAAAAAGAAIEMARARVAAGEPERQLPALAANELTSSDPAVTVRMQRDRILRALAEDIAATTVAGAAAASAERAASQSGSPSARAEPGRNALHARDDLADDFVADDGLDPVALAAAAIARLRARARSDLAELRVQYHRLDMLVLLAAFILIVVAGRVHDGLVAPPTVPFDPGGEHGLSFDQPRGWLVSPGEPPPPPRIVHDAAPSPARPASAPYRVELTSTSEPTARIEVLIDKKPAWSNIVTGLDLDRRTRWGELYTLDDSSVRSIEDHQWLRTAYRFAHVADKGDVPRVDRALEYATIDREQIYVVTFFGSAAEIERLEDVVAPTLRVATQTGLPLVPQTGHLSTRNYPNAVAHAFEATVMVVVADIVDGRLRARGGGSGVIVGRDGSILTNYHVIHDRNGRLHDVFVIGRFSEQDKAPQLHCAGKPSRSKLQRELDLALIKCDLDLDGRSSTPTSGSTTWSTLPTVHTADIKMGQRIWVLGYPDVGGGGLTLSEGAVEGWSGVDGAAGKDFLKTDAAIRHGNSGGPVVDDGGRLVGIASAVRTKQNAAGDIVEVVQAGGRVRPIAAASDLLAIAAAGWTPREGATDVELQPSAIEAPSEGVQISSHVLDVANEAAVRDALVLVMRAGVNAGTVDVNRLDDQVLAYGRSNAQGEVVLKQPVPAPGTYTLMVVARGYEPMIGELTLEAGTPAVFDPWGKLQLRAR